MPLPTDALVIVGLGSWLTLVVLSFRLRFARVATLLGLSSVVLFVLDSSAEPRTRAIVIIDHDVTDRGDRLRAIDRTLGVRSCAIHVRGADEAPRDAPWSSACSLGAAGYVDTVAMGLQRGLAQVETIGIGDRLLDYLAGTHTRIVLVPGPSRLGAAAGDSIDVDRLAERARWLDVRVDVPAQLDDDDQEQPELEIGRAQQTATALRNTGVEQFTFDLTLQGIRTPRDVQIECLFAGSCTGSEDCTAPDSECVQGQCTRACSSDLDCQSPDEHRATCRQGTCRTPSSAVPRRLEAELGPEIVPAGTGLRLGSFSLADFEFHTDQSGSSMDRGWYPLTCSAGFEHEGERHEVTVGRYVYATNEGWSVIWGEGRGLWLEGEPGSWAEAQPEATRDLVELLARTSLVYVRDATEEEIRQDPRTLDRVLQGDTPLRLLLVHDASRAFWEAHCGRLLQFVQRGGNLLVSVPPPRVPGCDLPAFASDADGVQVVDQRPQVSFVLDDSRIGRLQFSASITMETFASARARSLLDGIDDVQVPLVEGLANSLGWSRSDPGFRPRTSKPGTAPLFVLRPPVPNIASAQAKGEGIGGRQMAEASALVPRLERLPPLADARLGVADVAVVFAYDVDTPGGSVRAIERRLGRGQRIIVVPIGTPYAAAVPAGQSLQKLLRRVDPKRSRPLGAQRQVRQRLVVATPQGVVPARAWDGRSAIDLAGDVAQVDRVRRAILAYLHEIHRQSASRRVRVQTFHRFVDERAATPSPGGHSRWASRNAEPLRFVQLRPNLELGPDVARLFALGRSSAPAALDPYELAYGAIVGQGHVMVLGYSVLDGASDDQPRLTSPFREQLRRLYDGDNVDPLGLGVFAQFGHNTERLVPVPTEVPRLMAIDVDDRRFVELRVSRTIDPGSSVDALFLVDRELCDREGTEAGARLTLVDLDPRRQQSRYLLTPLQRNRLCDGRACEVALCSEHCDPRTSGCEYAMGEGAIHLLPAADPAVSVVENLRLHRQLQWLQTLSGGWTTPTADASGPELDFDDEGPLGRIAALAALLALFWSATYRRLRRRVSGSWLRPRGSSHTVTEGVLRGAGEALGLPSASVPAGAFAGYRPLEGGDNLGSVERRDLLGATRLRPGELAVIPRVAKRIETGPRELELLIHVSASMRVGTGALPPKLLAAQRFAAAMIEAAGPLNGSIHLVSVGQSGPPLRTEPLDASAYGVELEAFFAALARIELDVDVPVVLPQATGAGTVLVSDYFDLELPRLREQAERLEVEGSPVGFVHAWSRTEWTHVRFGFTGTRGGLTDRTGLSVRQLQRLHAEHYRGIVATLSSTKGGVTGIGAEMSDEAVLTAIVEGELMELLR